ncbi:MAG: response regulator transcription factor [Actinomycetes bacterium]
MSQVVGSCCCAAAHLSVRQIEIVLRVALGMSDREIARDLQLSPHTVRHHLTSAMQTAGACSRAQLVALCYASGVLATGTWPPTAGNGRCLRLPRGAGI